MIRLTSATQPAQAVPLGRHPPGAGAPAGGIWSADLLIGLVITVAILGVLRSAVRQVGARLMDAVDPGLTVTQAHDIAHHAETHLLDQVRRLTAATIHTSPTGTHPA
ncbi:MAG TPA: cation transporter dimerization domain-containing protein [Streptosporangiaceae bacterium]|jgi:divalent metal cation (Fe/Co/Zn/Cd) transporter